MAMQTFQMCESQIRIIVPVVRNLASSQYDQFCSNINSLLRIFDIISSSVVGDICLLMALWIVSLGVCYYTCITCYWLVSRINISDQPDTFECITTERKKSRPRLVVRHAVELSGFGTCKRALEILLDSGEEAFIGQGVIRRKNHELFKERYNHFSKGIKISDLIERDEYMHIRINQKHAFYTIKTKNNCRSRYSLNDLYYDLDHGYLAVFTKSKLKSM